MKRLPLIVAALAILAFTSTAHAGPFILAGTDADDHGFANISGNQDGWLFMQRALENLAASPELTRDNNPTSRVLAILASSVGQARNAALSAFNLSSLPGMGWTSLLVDGEAALTTFFAGGLGATIDNVALLMMVSGGNVGGGATAGERNVFTANATAINDFLGAGGGLFSQSNGYGWVSALVPGLTAPNESSTGISLTAAGMAAFPGLTNQDLSAGPYHNRFANFGSIPVLGTSNATGNAIIIGAAGGTVTDPTLPTPIPEPTSMLLVGTGLVGLVRRYRRRGDRESRK